MNEVERLWLSTIAEDARMIAYRPKFREITGSVTSAILLQQILYRWKHNNFQPFYKYKEPCDADGYRGGDSWCEELAFSRSEFDTALKRIGQRVSASGKAKDKEALVWYWSMPDRKTWYEINYQALCKVGIPRYVEQESNSTNSDNPAFDLYTKNTSETTTENGGSDRVDPPDPIEAGPAPLTARAEQLAVEESFDPPTDKRPKAATNGRLKPKAVTHRHYDPRKVVQGFIPAGKGETAVEVYFERFSPAQYKLTAPNQDDIIAAVQDLDLWRRVVTAWSQNDYNPKNISGMLDWYKDPARFGGNGHQKGSHENTRRTGSGTHRAAEVATPTPAAEDPYARYAKYTNGT